MSAAIATTGLIGYVLSIKWTRKQNVLNATINQSVHYQYLPPSPWIAQVELVQLQAGAAGVDQMDAPVLWELRT